MCWLFPAIPIVAIAAVIAVFAYRRRTSIAAG
jgi:hypothetical protein